VTGLLIVLVLAAGSAALWWRRRRRADALLRNLGRALALAAEAQGVWWRLERRYTDDLTELARVRRELAPLVEAGADARWELGTSEDGSSFDLAILALPVRGPLRLVGRRRSLGYQRLLTAHGDRGVIAYDSFAEDARYLPRHPQRASALA
jgi:hypothetical protein